MHACPGFVPMSQTATNLAHHDRCINCGRRRYEHEAAR